MHPNQLALPVAVTRWVDQSQQLDDATAIDRLGAKLGLICEALNVLTSDADEVPVEFAGLSVVDLMSAQSTLSAEIGTRRRFMAAVSGADWGSFLRQKEGGASAPLSGSGDYGRAA